ncbi:hypothetical protein ACROYT_G029578 [Oculina patagonica]
MSDVGNIKEKDREDAKEKVLVVDCEIESWKDGHWGWVVCLSAALVQFVVLGIHNSFGILYIVFVREYGWSKALTGYIGSMGLGMNFFFGPFTSALCDRFGCRIVAMFGGIISVTAMFATSFVNSLVPIYLTYSILWGMGSSMCYVPTFLMVGRYFERRRSLANGIITAGSAVGALVMGPTINMLLESVGWRNTMRFLGGVSCVMVLAALTYRPAPVKREVNFEKKKKKLIDISVWKNKGFVVWALALGIFNLGYFVPYVYLPTHASYLNIPESQASFLIGFLSVGSLFGRLFFGHFSDYRWVNRLYLYQTALLIMAVTTTLCPLATSYGGLIVYTILFGIFDGVFVALIAVLTGDIVGFNKLPSALGFLYLVFSVPIMTGSLIAGFLSEITSTYNEAFYFSGAAIAVCTCVLSLVPVFAPMRRPGPTEIKMKSDEFEERKRRPSFFEKYVQRYFSVSNEDPCEVVEYLLVVDKVTAV